MKKYIASCVPLIVCTVLALLYGTKTPKDYPDPSYPYQTEAILDYLSVSWFYIGLIMTGTFISMFIISDIFDLIVRLFDKWRERSDR
jgi:hypothetical protein